METCKIFIASSAELSEERQQFRQYLSTLNDVFHYFDLYLQLEQWEYFNDAISADSKQGDYNEVLKTCDIVICLFYTKAGKYTQLEFETAYNQFTATGKPLIYTYFKEAEQQTADASLDEFKEKLAGIKHFYTRYASTQDLHVQFRTQLDLLFVKGALKLNENIDAVVPESKLLTRKLIESLADYSEYAALFLETIEKDDLANWEMRSDNKYFSDARNNILCSYASVIGELMRKLFACEKASEYFSVSVTLAKRTLQLMCFTMVAALRDLHAKNDNDAFEKLVPLQDNLFKCANEPDILKYVALLKFLIAELRQNEVVFPIAELAALENELEEDAAFYQTCKTLHEFAIDNSKAISPKRMELVLTDFLVRLNFLAAYKMISIREISYEEVWLKDDTHNKGYRNVPKYIHCFTPFGSNDEPRQKYDFSDTSYKTESIVFFKDEYTDGISLFPFIIDYSTLVGEQLPNICFYTCYGSEIENSTRKIRKAVRYFKADKTSSGKDNEDDVVILFNDDVESKISGRITSDIITKMKNDNGGQDYKSLKKNDVFKAFQQVKLILTGENA